MHYVLFLIFISQNGLNVDRVKTAEFESRAACVAGVTTVKEKLGPKITNPRTFKWDCIPTSV